MSRGVGGGAEEWEVERRNERSRGRGGGVEEREVEQRKRRWSRYR